MGCEPGKILSGKIGELDESFVIGLQFQQRADGGHLAAGGIEIDAKLRVVVAARHHAKIADDWGETCRGFIGEGKGRERIESLKHIALARESARRRMWDRRNISA